MSSIRITEPSTKGKIISHNWLYHSFELKFLQLQVHFSSKIADMILKLAKYFYTLHHIYI